MVITPDRHSEPTEKRLTKGQKKREEILLIARRIIAENGYYNFTLREVSEQAGISLSNLQYYFQTKDDLFFAICIKLWLEYRNDLSIATNLASSERAVIMATVDYCLGIWQQPELSVWLTVYERAFFDERFRKIKHESYSFMQRAIEEVVSAERPELPKKAVTNYVTMIIAMMDGFVIRQYPFDLDAVSRSAIENELKSSAIALYQDYFGAIDSQNGASQID